MGCSSQWAGAAQYRLWSVDAREYASSCRDSRVISRSFGSQEDATRLANRLAQLKKEEERSQKRIEETRKRAAEIVNARRRNGEPLTDASAVPPRQPRAAEPRACRYVECTGVRLTATPFCLPQPVYLRGNQTAEGAGGRREAGGARYAEGTDPAYRKGDPEVSSRATPRPSCSISS